MFCSKIIITSLMAVSVMMITNSSNLFTDQIVYAQTVIDTLNVRDYSTASEFNPVSAEIYDLNRGNNSISIVNTDNLTDIKDIPKLYDRFGHALAAGDFNKDGYKDLAIGVPLEDVKITSTSPNIVDAGTVNVIYGSSSGLNFLNYQILYQGYNGIADTPEGYDHFGSALAAGYFNKDDYVDLAIGVPLEDVRIKPLPEPETADVGVVNVIYGSPSGLTSNGNQTWYQGNNRIADRPEPGDNFGYALAAGDFNKDGLKDLAIGVPYEDYRLKPLPAPEAADVGVVNVIYGSPSGLTSNGNKMWFQGTPGIAEDPELKDRFGYALAAGNFGKGSAEDLAIGVPLEDVVPIFARTPPPPPTPAKVDDAGMINVIYGSPAGLASTGNEIWYQYKDLVNVPNGIKDPLETYDHFGSALAAGNFNKNPIDDLAIGVPGEDLAGGVNAGMINVIYGSSLGLVKGDNQIWYQGYKEVVPNAIAILGGPEKDDQFGNALAAGNFGKDSAEDIAIGVPGENIERGTTLPAIIDAGVINVIYGSNSVTGLASKGNQMWYQGYNGILDSVETIDRFSSLGDRFGSALAAGNFGKDSAEDLAIGVPGEDLETVTETQISIKPDAGAVNVIYGISSGLLNSKNNQFLHQDQVKETGFMYVVNQIVGSGSVTVLNTTSNTVVGSPIPVGSNPVGIAFDPVHKRMYVANEFNNTISVIDITKNTVVGSPIPDGRNNPLAIAFDPVHNRMYVANQLGKNISVIDTTSNTVVGSPIPVGNSPQGIAFDPVHKRMYVTIAGVSNNSNTVSIINTNNNSVVGPPIPVGSNPGGIAFDPVHNRMYVANSGENGISVIDTNNNTVITTIALGVGSAPVGVAFDPVHDRMYVTDIGTDTVSVIDTNTKRVVPPPIPVGRSPYEGIAFDPLHDRMYVTNLHNNTISVIDTNNNCVISTIDGINTPRGIAFASLTS
jgi:YVTN family beta-propeller protein